MRKTLEWDNKLALKNKSLLKYTWIWVCFLEWLHFLIDEFNVLEFSITFPLAQMALQFFPYIFTLVDDAKNTLDLCMLLTNTINYSNSQNEIFIILKTFPVATIIFTHLWIFLGLKHVMQWTEYLGKQRWINNGIYSINSILKEESNLIFFHGN
jgi:hypothetical protein